MPVPEWVVRAALVAASLGAWFWTQARIGGRAFPSGRIGDRVLEWTAPVNRYLVDHPRWADRLLVVTSAVVDLLGLFLIARAIFGPSTRPLIGLLLLFALRQVCQSLCALPEPENMIWRHPGFPSLLVTYDTACDLFFSGHTALAVFGCVELAHAGGPWLTVLGVTIALLEIGAVLVLRAHYFMDVFTGAITALWVWTAANAVAPALDRLLG